MFKRLSQIFDLYKFLFRNFRFPTNYFLFILLILSPLVEFVQIVVLAFVISVFLNKSSTEPNISSFDFINNYLINIEFQSLVLFLILIYLVSIFFVFSTKIFVIFLSQKIGFRVSNKIYSNYLNWDFTRVSKTPVSFLINNLTYQCDRLTNHLAICSLELISRILFLLINISTVTFLFPYEMLIILPIATILYLIVFFTSKHKFKFFGDKISTLSQSKIDLLKKTFLNFKYIKTSLVYKKFLDQYKKIENELKLRTASIDILSMFPRYFFELIIFSIIFIFLFLDGNSNGIAAQEDIILTIVIFIRFLPNAQQVYSYTSRMYAHFDAFKILSKEYEVSNELFLKKNYSISKNMMNIESLKIENVSFEYDKKNILNNINLSVDKNEKILIYGDTGSGKSTVLDLLSGLIKPSKGKIIINNKEIEEINYFDYLSSIGIVYETVPMDNLTIREFITNHQSEKFDKQSFFNCIKKTESEFIHKFEKKEETILNDLANNLSSGQIQRLALARALYKKPQVLFLDEATNKLDEVTENKIIEELLNDKNITLIMISHNSNLRNKFDKKFELRAGNLEKL